MEAKHTPGPWEIGDYDEELQAVRIRAGGFVPLTPAVALAAGLDKPRAYSNARLIAAAPELLEALQGLLDCHRCPGLHAVAGHCPWCDAARAAIAQAAENKMDRIMTLRDLWETIGDCNAGVVRNDRGNGSAGPAFIDADAVADCGDTPLTAVGEDEDEEAWELARHAHQSLRLDPPAIVCTGEEQHPAGEYLSSNPYQAIYSV
jgi:hypothetical protein